LSEHTGDSSPLESVVKAAWLRFVTGLFLFAISAILCWALERQEEAILRAKTKTTCENLASYVEADLRSRLPALRRMARSYLADVPGFQALELVGPDSKIRSVVPLEGNEKALGLDLSSRSAAGRRWRRPGTRASRP